MSRQSARILILMLYLTHHQVQRHPKPVCKHLLLSSFASLLLKVSYKTVSPMAFIGQVLAPVDDVSSTDPDN